MKKTYAIFFRLFVMASITCTLVPVSSCNTDSNAIPQIPNPNCLISRIDYSKDHYELREYDSSGHLKSIANYWGGAIARTNYTWNEGTNSYSIENFQEVKPDGYEGPLVITPTIGTIQFNKQGRWVGTTINSKANSDLLIIINPEYNDEGKLSKLTYSYSHQGTNFESSTTYEYSNENLIKMVNGGTTTYFEYFPDKVAHPTSYAFLLDESLYSLLSKNLLKKKTETYPDKSSATTVTTYSYQYNDKDLPTGVNALLEYNYPNNTDTVSYMYYYQCF